MNYAIYNLNTGKIMSRMVCPPDFIDIQMQGREEFFLNCPTDATHIINNEPVTIIPEVVPPTTEESLIAIRARRNQLLSACDWTQMPDTRLTVEQRQAWAEYRQALRDCDLANPVWPTPP